jgi:hypothetical protein
MALNPSRSDPVPPAPRTPQLLRFLAAHMGFGIAVGIAFASLVVMTNTAGLNDLLTGDEHPYIAIAMLNIMCALTFGSLAMGIGVMTLPWGKLCDMRERQDHDEGE